MKLVKSTDNSMLFGVCGGIAEYFGWDATFVRVGFALGALLGFGTFILLYIVLMFIMPKGKY
jgi:phage shock protein PspC (stress-responsive transcriptional regulator)